MVILTYSASFNCIACRYFSKWPLKIFSGGNHPPYSPSLTAYLTPPEGGTPIFFFQNDRKGCSLDYPGGFGHFLFGFGAAGKNYRGDGNHPHPLGKTRVNMI